MLRDRQRHKKRGGGGWRKTKRIGTRERPTCGLPTDGLLHEFELHLRKNEVESARDRLATITQPGARPHGCTEARGEIPVAGKSMGGLGGAAPARKIPAEARVRQRIWSDALLVIARQCDANRLVGHSSNDGIPSGAQLA